MITLVLSLVTVPYFTKKDIYFGIRMPNIDVDKLKKIRMRFTSLNIIFGLIATYLMLKIQDPIWGIVGVTFGYIGVAGFIYLLAYNEVKSLKRKTQGQTGQIEKRQVTVVDTSFTKERGKGMLVSPWYFLIPVLIVIIIAVISLVNYDLIPDPMPMHYNAYGEVDRWSDKSYLSVLMLPLVSLAMTGMFYWVYLIIGKSKQQLRASSPRVSAKQNRKYRKIWSGYMIASASLMNMLFGYLQLIMIREPVVKSGQMMVITLAITAIMIISSIAIAIYTGNGGSKLKVDGEEIEDFTDQESDDDQFWKWGMFYCNPSDPSVFVEKRVGIGWTLNIATAKGKLFVVGTVVFTIVVVIMAILNS